EDAEPDQRPHQRREKAAALRQEAQPLAPYDAFEAAQVVRHAEPDRCRLGRRNDVPLERSLAHFSAPARATSASKAARIEVAPAAPITSGALPSARTRPRCKTMTRESSSTSSMRCVAQ